MSEQGDHPERRKGDRRVEDAERGDLLLAKLNRNFRWLLIVCVLLIIGGASEFFDFNGITSGQASRLARDEHKTCVIQQNGLPAGHQLAAAMVDIHKLLTLPATSTAARLAAKNTPASVRHVESDLALHLQRYTRAEAKQPQARKC